MTEPDTERSGAPTERAIDAACCGLLALFFVAWHAAGVFGGLSYYAEDTAAYYVANRSIHHALLQGGGWSFWDPLPGLGMPRLANIQSGLLSPISSLFYLAPAARVYSFYPAIVLSLLSIFSFALFRTKGLSYLPALFGALAWSTIGQLTTHVQHPPVIESLLWLPATLMAWQIALRTGGALWIVLAGLFFAFQIFGGSPQYILYNALVMIVWMGHDIVSTADGSRARRLAWAASIAAIGLGIASWQWLPFLEFSGESHRNLLNEPGAFAAQFRAAPYEIALAFVAELFWFIEPPTLAHGAPYPNLPNSSLLVLGFAIFGLAKSRRSWPLAAAAGLFLLGMLGDSGGVSLVLSELVPSMDRVRAPYRMLIPATLLIAWLAGLGVQRLIDADLPGRRGLALGAVLWVAIVGWTLKRPLDRYVDPAAYRVPEVLANAEGRLVVDYLGSKRLPLFSVNAGIAAGVPTLLMREVLIPGNFFEGWFVSQLGSLEQEERVDRAIVSAALPLLNPEAPLMRAYGLRTVARFLGPEGIAIAHVPAARERFSVIPNAVVLEGAAERWAWARRPDWDVRSEALLAEPIAGELVRAWTDTPAHVRVVLDEPDEQELEVESGGGLLVVSALRYPGWRAQIDGSPTDVLEADFALRAIALPPGQHRVRWRYQPPWIPWAWVATLLGLLVCGSLAFLNRSRRRDP